MNKENQKKKVTIIGIVAILAVLIVLSVVVYIARYSPTKETMSGYTYFGIENGNENVLVILDGQNFEDSGIYVDDRLYIKQDLIEDSINIRFYYDEESGNVLYSDTHHIYSFVTGEAKYTDEEGHVTNTDNVVVLNQNGERYLDWEYVASHTDLNYELAKNPNRLVINTSYNETNCADTKKKATVRYRGGVKSLVLETLPKGTRVTVTKDLGNWLEVITPSGIKGYVKQSELNKTYSYVRDTTYQDEYESISYNQSINLAWFQVGGVAGNATLDSALSGTSGINIVSPTWYSITGNDGTMSCFASQETVTDIHNRGMEVWALVDDFNTNVDFKTLYQSKKARTKMVNTLISDAKKYGFDGINLDFEKVKKEYSRDFLQFVRELSIECEKAGIVLSTDNYKPESYNECYRLTEQASFVDYVVLMAYDEHYAGTEAGSVSSLPFFKEAISDMINLVPSNQIVVGIPFFTRIWTTTNGKTTSSAVGMDEAINQMTKDGFSALWNEEIGQYAVNYEKNGSTIQIWFEEEQSVEERMKAISESNVSGVAGWKLGLEKKSVWGIINKYLNK